jgi:hypothetical protein
MRRIFYRARSVRDFSALRSRISRLSVSYAISTPTDRSAALNLRQFVRRQAGANLRKRLVNRIQGVRLLRNGLRHPLLMVSSYEAVAPRSG